MAGRQQYASVHRGVRACVHIYFIYLKPVNFRERQKYASTHVGGAGGAKTSMHAGFPSLLSAPPATNPHGGGSANPVRGVFQFTRRACGQHRWQRVWCGRVGPRVLRARGECAHGARKDQPLAVLVRHNAFDVRRSKPKRRWK